MSTGLALPVVGGSPAGPPCTTDADCDDGWFCTGVETCVDEVCLAGTDPCDPLYCDEDAQECLGGACCQPNLSCIDFVEAGDRDGPGETYYDEQVCVEVTCPVVGACCYPRDVCFNDVASDVCAGTGGSTLGAGLACDGDEDGDGVVGCDDQCPYTPPGETVNARGCSDLGACCFRGYWCIDETLEEDCWAVRGSFQGRETTCDDGCVLVCNADFNENNIVDLADYAIFWDCMAGPDTYPFPTPPMLPEECIEAFDFEDDGDVDLEDAAAYQLAHGGVCDSLPPPCFTLNQDNLIGTDGDDKFCAPLEFVPGQGRQMATLQTGDSANGRAGLDALNAEFNAPTADAVVATLTAIEIFNLSDFGTEPTTLSGVTITGITEINSVISTQTVTAERLSQVVDLGIYDTGAGLAVGFTAAATTGTSDATNLTLSGVWGGVVNLTTGTANGLEFINVLSAGDTPNVLDDLVQTTGTTLTTLTATGSQDLHLKVLPDTISTIDAVVLSGDLMLGNGSSTSDYETFATVDISSITGGAGDDVFIFAATLDSSDADGTTEFLDGGDGTDVLQCSLAASLSTAAHIKNIEELRINATATATMALTSVTGLETLTIESDATVTGSQNMLTLVNFPNIPTLAYRGNGAEGSQFFDTVTYTTLGGSGSSDTLAVTLGNRGTALGTSGSSNAFNVGLLTAPNIETMTYTITDMPTSAATPTTLGGITAAGMNSLTVISNGDVILGTITGETILLATVNLSGVSGRIRSTSTIQQMATGGTVTLTANNDNIIVTPGSGETGITVNCGAGDDTILHTSSGASTVTINGEAGDDTMTTDGTTGDTMTGGTGNDTMTGVGGDDTISGGAGNDTIVGGAGADTITGGSGNDTITGGTGVDTIVATSGTNTITGATGADVITCGTGVDTLQYDEEGANTDLIGSFTVGSGGDIISIDVSDINGGALADAEGTVLTGSETPTMFNYTVGAATAENSTDNILYVTNVSGIDATSDIDTALGNNNMVLDGGSTGFANTEGMLVIYYDADGGQMVIAYVEDSAAATAGVFDGTGSTWVEITRATMSTANYALLVDANIAFR